MAQIKDVGKRGDWYTVRGVDSRGRPTSVDIPAPSVERLTEKAARKLFERSIENASRSGD